MRERKKKESEGKVRENRYGRRRKREGEKKRRKKKCADDGAK